MPFESYSAVQKKLNELLCKFGATKLLLILSNITDDIDEPVLIAIEKTFKICASAFDVTKKQILTTNLKADNVVFARRAAIYILSNDINLEHKTLKDLFKLRNGFRISQINQYTDDCMSGKLKNDFYTKKFSEIRETCRIMLEEQRSKSFKNDSEI